MRVEKVKPYEPTDRLSDRPKRHRYSLYRIIDAAAAAAALLACTIESDHIDTGS